MRLVIGGDQGGQQSGEVGQRMLFVRSAGVEQLVQGGDGVVVIKFRANWMTRTKGSQRAEMSGNFFNDFLIHQGVH